MSDSGDPEQDVARERDRRDEHFGDYRDDLACWCGVMGYNANCPKHYPRLSVT